MRTVKMLNSIETDFNSNIYKEICEILTDLVHLIFSFSTYMPLSFFREIFCGFFFCYEANNVLNLAVYVVVSSHFDGAILNNKMDEHLSRFLQSKKIYIFPRLLLSSV